MGATQSVSQAGNAMGVAGAKAASGSLYSLWQVAGMIAGCVVLIIVIAWLCIRGRNAFTNELRQIVGNNAEQRVPLRQVISERCNNFRR